ncbi:putative enoyl-CoA hydratase 2 [Diplonema papillatum]|nr:putative enoyl-CoA hydratase 2 [Diplonema papillatum]
MFRRSCFRLCVWGDSRECFLRAAGEEKTGAVFMEMNRAARKNAFGRVMLEQFGECLAACERDASIRSVVLRSTVPGVFSAGADLKERREMTQNEASAVANKTTGVQQW